MCHSNINVHSHLQKTADSGQKLARQLRMTISQFDNNQVYNLSQKGSEYHANSNDPKDGATAAFR